MCLILIETFANLDVQALATFPIPVIKQCREERIKTSIVVASA